MGRSGANGGLDLGELSASLGGVDERGDFAAAVDNGRVVTVPKEAADLLEWQLSLLAQEVHGNVAGLGDRLSAAGTSEGSGGHGEVGGHGG